MSSLYKYAFELVFVIYSGQIERRDPDGSVRVLLPGSDTVSSKVEGPDEISIEKLSNGDTVILLPTGERELHTKDYMVCRLKQSHSSEIKIKFPVFNFVLKSLF